MTWLVKLRIHPLVSIILALTLIGLAQGQTPKKPGKAPKKPAGKGAAVKTEETKTLMFDYDARYERSASDDPSLDADARWFGYSGIVNVSGSITVLEYREQPKDKQAALDKQIKFLTQVHTYKGKPPTVEPAREAKLAHSTGTSQTLWWVDEFGKYFVQVYVLESQGQIFSIRLEYPADSEKNSVPIYKLTLASIRAK